MQFSVFKQAVAAQFALMSKGDLFRTKADKDEMWAYYLNSFPEGTNEIYRTRREYDCSCCRQFIRAVGNAVAIVDGKLVSIWDVVMPTEPNFQFVADSMAALVKSHPIDNMFLHTERTAGTDKNFEDAVGGVKTWEHFFVNIPTKFVCKGTDIGPKLSESRAQRDVLFRSLTEITDDAVDTVLELIQQNSLYRGEEHKFAVTEFKKLKQTCKGLALGAVELFVWSKASSLPVSVSKIRNTSIGTLLTALSEGQELEHAVRAFEAMVAPANYKRPTALVTKGMIEKAKATVEELGLTSALQRRYAMLTDINLGNILFANRSTKKVLSGNVFDDISSLVTNKPKNLDKVEEVSIEKFLSDILPNAQSIEALVEGRHTNNLVSLIAPADPTAGRMFKWDNAFSWSYNGDFADSIKERVKKAGGNVEGDLCCRLAWYNYDDLDFHLVEPNKFEISYHNKRSPSGGCLDVDMNAGYGTTREPVENIFYSTTQRMLEGVYTLGVHQYSKRESTDVGFEVEIDFKGAVCRFAYAKPVKQGEVIVVAKFRYTRAAGLEILESLPMTQVSKKVWNIQTENFQPVNVVMLSPNHWDGHGVGNKHYFFMLDGCQNDGTARGFYNEFLKADLEPHRKVLEIVGSKMRTDESANQLSGLGFSSTQRNSLLVRVQGAFTRTVKVLF